MSASVMRRRLTWVELAILPITLVLFYVVTDRKEIGYAVGVLGGIGILALTFFRPRYGLVFAMVLLFAESTINVINALAKAADENNLTGVPYILQTQWFAWGVLIIIAVMLLSYFCRESLAGRKLRPLTGFEWALLFPLMLVVTYLPISLVRDNWIVYYMMDIIPMCIYAGIVVLGRVFFAEKDRRESRYFFLDWFIFLNFMILIPLWAYCIFTQPWRTALVGIAAVRFGTGPYDFNFFLVPLLGMILAYDEKLDLRRRRYYQFAFFLSLARVVLSMFRGAIGGTFIAIVIVTFLVESGRRWKWVRNLLLFATAILLIGMILITSIPVVRTTINVALFRRVSQALSGSGTGGASLEYRAFETQEALEEWVKEPIFGLGPGAVITKYFDPRKPEKEELYIHSGYVWFLYKMGIPGVAVILVFFSGIIGTCIQLLRRKLFNADRGWVIGTLAATIAMLPVIHYNNMLIRSQGAYAMMLLFFGLSMIVMRYRGVARDTLPPAEGNEV